MTNQCFEMVVYVVNIPTVLAPQWLNCHRWTFQREVQSTAPTTFPPEQVRPLWAMCMCTTQYLEHKTQPACCPCLTPPSWLRATTRTTAETTCRVHAKCSAAIHTRQMFDWHNVAATATREFVQANDCQIPNALSTRSLKKTCPVKLASKTDRKMWSELLARPFKCLSYWVSHESFTIKCNLSCYSVISC